MGSESKILYICPDNAFLLHVIHACEHTKSGRQVWFTKLFERTLKQVPMLHFKTSFRDLLVIICQNKDDRMLLLERGLVTDNKARRLSKFLIDFDRFAADANGYRFNNQKGALCAA